MTLTCTKRYGVPFGTGFATTQTVEDNMLILTFSGAINQVFILYSATLHDERSTES
ncbi:MAG: hypothetical protein HOO06_02000 [Bdellovibrionaceae bacterium]|nr:hypothetical protein [Pseudobdellovibrionaceae bacterium]